MPGNLKDKLLFTAISLIVVGIVGVACGKLRTPASPQEQGAIPCFREQAEVIEAAKRSLPQLLSFIPLESMEKFGFKDLDEIRKVTLGEPVEIYILPLEALKAYIPGQKVSSLLIKHPDHRWDVPLLVEGEAKTMLNMALIRGRWQAIGIGGIELPKRLQALRDSLATIYPEGGYSLKLMIIPRLCVDGGFSLVETEGGEFLCLLTCTSILPGEMEVLKLYPPSEIMPKIANQAKQLTWPIEAPTLVPSGQ
jgi:hypothetical protein